MRKLTSTIFLLLSFNSFAEIAEIKDVKLLDIYNTADEKVVQFYAKVNEDKILKAHTKYLYF